MKVLHAIESVFQEHDDLLKRTMEDKDILMGIREIISHVVGCYSAGGKILLCGNGGSAADAQHIAAEWQGRYLLDRKALHAEALHTNTSYLTAVANDYGFDEVYARAVEAQGKEDDLLIALSTSGQSVNIVKALQKAGERGMFRIGLTGTNKDSEMTQYCDLVIHIPSNITARIQEMHILIGHIVCHISEEILFGQRDETVI